MHKLDDMMENIYDEIKDAQKYAEMYIIYANTYPQWAKMYASMANQELEHEEHLMSIYREKVKEFKWVSEEDMECWEKALKKASERASRVKLMLNS